MTTVKTVKQVVAYIVNKLKHEPVAVWGVVIAAVLGVLKGFGVPATDIEVVTGVLSLAGIPVVRSKVTPAQAVKDVVQGQAN